MRFRRKIIRSYLKPNEVPMTMTSWPRLGVDGGGFTEPETQPSQESSSKSAYVAQEITNPHARFPYVFCHFPRGAATSGEIKQDDGVW